MAAINWIQYNERVVGENSPIFPDDVDNRPLKEVIEASLLAITDDFPGFPPEFKGSGSPEGVQIALPGSLYFQQDAPFVLWIKQQNTDATGWSVVGTPIVGTPDYIPKYNAAGDGIEDSIMFQAVAPDSPGIIIGTDPNDAASETFRTTGGMISKGAGANSTIIGEDASAAGSQGIAIGYQVAGAGFGSIVIGSSITTGTGQDTIVIGRLQTVAALGQGGIAIGNQSTIVGAGSVSVGYGANVNATLGIAIGQNSSSFGSGAISIGSQAGGFGANSICIGVQANATNTAGIAIGEQSTANTLVAIAIGDAAKAYGATGAITIGSNSQMAVTGPGVDASILIGYSSFMQGGSVPSTANAANILIGSRSTLTSAQTGGFQPVDYHIIIGAGNNIVNTIGGTYQGNIVIGNNISGDAMNNSMVIGNMAFGLPSQFAGLVIGNNTRIDAGGTLSTLIGHSARNVGGNDNLIIGRGAIKQGGGGGQENVIIGTLCSINQTDYAIALGSTAQIGSGCTGTIAIGRQANIQFQDCLAIGPGCTPPARYHAVLGSNFTGADYRIFILGNTGDLQTGALTDVMWRMSNANYFAGNNQFAGNLIIQTSLSTGNANPGETWFYVGARTTLNGPQQTARAVLKIKDGYFTSMDGTVSELNFGIGSLVNPQPGGCIYGISTGSIIAAADRFSVFSKDQVTEYFRIDPGVAGATETSLYIYDIDNAALEQVTVGAADSGGTGFKLLCIPN